ncbi:MAG TPA: DUF2891 domain-containing protein [Myxococcales bacterium]|nr:DUF2891 domain-containing protein [Myxococcales bacterium]
MTWMVAVTLALNVSQASDFSHLALKCVRQEYPNKLDHTMNGPAEVLGPKVLHPAFYGCYDWHSSVHGHWMLATLLRQYPQMPEAQQIRALFDEHFAPEVIAQEVAYFGQPNRRSFERTYGWAWLLKLSAELRAWDNPDARRWAAGLQPLADVVAGQFKAFLPKQTYPIRTGVHPNTAYSLSMIFDYPDETLQQMIRERARKYFLADRAAPIGWEPGGEDFLSPLLEEAALMSRVLPAAEFKAWFAKFLPHLQLTPAVVADRTDPKIVHLDGLNLSRARCLFTLSKALHRPELARLAEEHAQASLPHIETGSYEGEHWLATFAVQALAAR